jgi:hypothetical protein
MKEAIHKRYRSVLKSGVSFHFFHCFTSHWLVHWRKMGALRNRGMCVLLGDLRANGP